MNKSYIICVECGTSNLNNEFCSNCGALLDLVLKRRLEGEKKSLEKSKQKEQAEKEPSKIELFLKNGAQHSNLVIRMFFLSFYYIWLFFAFVFGAIISLIIAAAAG
ncbi:MAG: hypothetical protein K2Y30_11785 [Flavobacteriaceae bacterium]|uniref:Zinc ribbon domain-containing protein n=1 Tax=Flavobacterium kayseriense TaxID=2764714 RepID=A0ABR7J506_9FLAO|nr:hypothetical protein [Flavobacterium kayseriense]MBC5840626.1 hypothetical protein [Flavobacterium kayseriense]MBC5846704.1 hypothetical protein [Flavobacterium kayseriense]MBX9888602.1 hypothetical protein [Flavobacteriaceae bacterium]